MSLTDTELEELIASDIECCEQSLHYFISEAFRILEPKREFVDGWHIQAIAEHLEACYNGEIRELLINMPPRHMKSLAVSVGFNAWVWTKSPDKRFLTSSYAGSLSIRDSVKTRRIIQSEWYQARWGNKFHIVSDQNAKEKFETNHYGYRLATSVGGTGTGEGGDYVCVDDPHKVTEAESKAMREKVLEWWDEEMSSRENDPKTGCKIIVMQRVNERDLSGHVLAQGGYTHLMLPAEFEPERKCITQIGWEDPRQEKGELLWPTRYDREAVDKLKKRMGSRTSAGQLQQRPSPEEGNIIKRGWWMFYKEIPLDMARVALSADLTFKDSEKSDNTAIGIWGRRNQDKYLLDIECEKMGINEQISTIKRFVLKWAEHEGLPPLDAKWIEDAANGAALVALCKKEISGMIAVPPRGSKIARAEAIAPQAEAGNIYLPDPTYQKHIDSGLAKKVLDFIEEWTLFPNGAHDDRVDMTSLGVSKLSEGIGSDWLPISLTQTSKWNR